MINGQKKWPFWLFVGILFFVFIYLIRDILLPFVLGIFIAYFLHPLVDKMQKGGMPRNIATLMIIISFFLFMLLLSLLIVPVVVGQLSDLLAALPDYAADYQDKYGAELSYWLGGLPQAVTGSVKTAVAGFSGVAAKLAGEFLGGIFHSGMGTRSRRLCCGMTGPLPGTPWNTG